MMPDSVEEGDETYSTMFASLRHPARRKILRMLAGKPKTFSEILEELGISSSHLTYHLENLGELVSKIGEGKYKLSAFGEAAVLTMKGVEEVPATPPKQLAALPLRWKSLLAVLMIGIVVLASISSMQFVSLNSISSEYEQLATDFDRVSAENARLSSYGVSTNGFVSFLQDVIQLNISKYAARLESHTIGRYPTEYPPELGGVAQEEKKYTLTSDESELDVDFRFRNQTLSRYVLGVLEFAPLYSEPQPTNVLDMADGLLQRYQHYTEAPYLTQMRAILETITEVEDLQTIQGNMKLAISTEGNDVKIQWIYTISGIDYQTKALSLTFDNGVLTELLDGWFLFSVGSTEVNISMDEAVEIAKSNAEDFAWKTENGLLVTDFTILEDPISVSLLPHGREEPLALVPYWYVVLQLDNLYPRGINGIAVGLWADTGEVADIQTLTV
jgi:DNA-binding transcriptional ArsR family regulator